MFNSLFFRNLSMALALFLLLFVFSCKDDDDCCVIPEATYGDGIFITNEGPFQNGTGTVTFWDRATGETKQDIFETANNGAQLGNIVQSITLIGGQAYIAVNNANKVVVVNADDFVKTGEVEGLKLPRYILPVSSNKAFVTQWVGTTGELGSVAVVDLNTLKVLKTIPAQTGPEKMLLDNGNVYVVNGGGFGRDSTLTIIDISTEEVVGTTVVGDNPSAILKDKNGFIWVLCKGYTDFTDPNKSTPGRLLQLGGTSIEVPNESTNLVINKAGDQLFFLDNSFGGNIYEMKVDASQPTLFKSGIFYALAFDEVGGLLLASDAKDFSAEGEVHFIKADGSVERTIPAGVIPGGFAVKQ